MSEAMVCLKRDLVFKAFELLCSLHPRNLFNLLRYIFIMNTKVLSLTAALLLGCSNAVQQAKTTTPTPTIAIKPARPDCSKLDLTQKVGFETSFLVEGARRFCYGIFSKENHYYDKVYECDKERRPLPDHYMIFREFAGPNKDYMEIKVVLAVSGELMDYVPFWQDSSGNVTSVPGQPVSNELAGMFQNGRKMLDYTRKVPQVCQGLLEYKIK